MGNRTSADEFGDRRQSRITRGATWPKGMKVDVVLILAGACEAEVAEAEAGKAVNKEEEDEILVAKETTAAQKGVKYLWEGPSCQGKRWERVRAPTAT